MRRLPLAKNILYLAWREASSYRLNLAMSFMVVAVPFLLKILFWIAVFDSTSELAGYTLAQIVSYYIITLLMGDIVYPTVLYDVADDIKSGTLSVHLVRPMPYPLWAFAIRMGSQAAYLVIVTASVLLAATTMYLLGLLPLAAPDLPRFALFGIVMLSAWVVGILISLAVSFLTFLLKTQAVSASFWALYSRFCRAL